MWPSSSSLVSEVLIEGKLISPAGFVERLETWPGSEEHLHGLEGLLQESGHHGVRRGFV